MDLTIDDFKKAAAAKNITCWDIHDCGICGYKCHYLITDDRVFYRSGCYCVGFLKSEVRSWEDILKHYQFDVQNNPQLIDKNNKFWGFGEKNGN